MAQLLDGKQIAADLRAELRTSVALLRNKGHRAPGLAVALVGDDPASAVYVRGKMKACAEIGIQSFAERLDATTTTDELLAVIDAWNQDVAVDGILVQLPLPRQIDSAMILQRIAATKDVDGFGIQNLGLLAAGKPGLVACTPAGVMHMLAHHAAQTGWEIKGKRALVVGRSLTVGRPMALLLLRLGNLRRPQSVRRFAPIVKSPVARDGLASGLTRLRLARRRRYFARAKALDRLCANRAVVARSALLHGVLHYPTLRNYTRICANVASVMLRNIAA